ncbi:hypothetical protein G9A89_022353 [Geosiphon pyriformis]|nr:hypothetical protein G9A89_022353 [Geosiphon pyriformis]
MVPRLEAQFLTFLARVTRAKVILEIGCFTGYSTLALAYGIRHREKKGAKLITIDKDPLGAVLAKKHVELAGVQKIVEFKIGDALEIIEGLNNDIKFDMIFLDANKKGYLDYYNTIMNKDLLAKNGYIVCDNVLFRGYVCAFSDPYVRFADLHTSDGPVPPEHKHIARYMHRFNDAVQKDQRVENLILPVFDGIMLIWKKKIAPVEVEYLEKYKRLTEMEEIKEKEIINSKSADQMGQGTSGNNYRNFASFVAANTTTTNIDTSNTLNITDTTKKNFNMASNFSIVRAIKTDYGIDITKFRSNKTGLSVIHVDVEGPLVNGYFALATEALDDDGCPHTLEHLVFLGSEIYPYKGVLDSLANRALAQGTNAWTDVDHTCYTITTAGCEGFLDLLPIYVDHILYPTLTDSGYVTEVHHINGKGENAGMLTVKSDHFIG